MLVRQRGQTGLGSAVQQDPRTSTPYPTHTARLLLVGTTSTTHEVLHSSQSYSASLPFIYSMPRARFFFPSNSYRWASLHLHRACTSLPLGGRHTFSGSYLAED